MIELICDKCGKNCDLNAYDIRVNVIHNPVPSSFKDLGEPHLTDDKSRMRMLLCQDCYRELGLPNIYTVNRNNKIEFRDSKTKSSDTE